MIGTSPGYHVVVLAADDAHVEVHVICHDVDLLRKILDPLVEKICKALENWLSDESAFTESRVFPTAYSLRFKTPPGRASQVAKPIARALMFTDIGGVMCAVDSATTSEVRDAVLREIEKITL